MKILVIRFSSIGDIVLTSPVIRCLQEQLAANIHFLTKSSFAEIQQNNPYLQKQILFDPSSSLDILIRQLRDEQYDLIVDLHNSLRSKRICAKLNGKKTRVKHPRWQRFLLLNWNKKKTLNHVVDRYMNTLRAWNIQNDGQGLDFYLDKNTTVTLPVSNYISWSIGASHDKKRLAPEQIAKVIDQLHVNVVLIGGPTDIEMATSITKKVNGTNLINLCGQLSIRQSAYVIKHSQLVLSNDSGMMHIAAAFNKKLISFWGCTKPSLGFSPYRVTDEIRLQSHHSQPCSKHGKKCKHTAEGCVKEIDVSEIIDAIKAMT